MANDEIKRLKAQQDANAAQIARLQMMLQAQAAQNQRDDYEDEEDEPRYQPPHQPGQHQQGQYQQADPNVMLLQAMTQQAAKQAAEVVGQNLNAQNAAQTTVKNRMERLLADYPALKQEDSPLVAKARDAYARIKQENPGLDEATRYELAVREAASLLGARPLTAPVEDLALSDWTMPSSASNPALPSRSTKSRLTAAIVKNAQLMGINVDPNSVEGKKNLAELSEYSARFNADQDETAFRYR